jgi:hypothetical protein
VSEGWSTATSATSATNGQGGRGFVANVANVAVDPPSLTFLRAPLRMPDGRRQYRLATTRGGAVTPAAVALVAEAKAVHVVVVADGSSLHIYTPIFYRGDLPQQLAALAPDVLALLRQQSAQRMKENVSSGGSTATFATSATSAQCGTEEAAESASAALGEFEAGVPRAWAEGFAALHQAKPPAWTILRPGLWPELVTAVGLFLDHWGAQAARLGWDPVDLFGASPRAPLTRLDQQGLIFFLRDGAEIVAMTADTVTIRRPRGALQTFRRPAKNAREPGTAPIWELIKEAKP